MSSGPGFDVMDVDVALVNDPKFRRIARELGRPEHVAPAIAAYVALLGESWKAAGRARIEDAWPPLLVFDPAVVESMRAVKLIDRTGRIPVHAWDRRFTDAFRRKQLANERYRRYNEKRGKPGQSSTNDDVATTSEPRGNDMVTTTPTDRSVRPSVPSEGRIPPPPAERGRRSEGTNPRAAGSNPRANGHAPRQEGTSPRQAREAEKRGPSQLAEILAAAAARAAEGES